MLAITHSAIALAGTSLILGTANPMALGLAILGSQLPDLDSTNSTIGKIFFPVSSWIEDRFPHRSITHSLLATAAIAALSLPIGYLLEDIVTAIAIARALMRLSPAELLIFDEPTGALDPKTEHEIYRLFGKIATDKIAVVISHRLALAKLADRIIVLENGKIIETGTHQELIAIGGQYHLMFTRQASSYQ